MATTIKIKKELFERMCVSLEKSVAVYELLHSHARGQTDLTEDQLSNVVTGVNIETREILHRVRFHVGPYGPAGWIAEASALAARSNRRLNG